MKRSAAHGFIGILLALAGVTVADAAPPGGYTAVLAPRSPEFMLFISHSFGGGGAGLGVSRPSFGFRVSQVRQLSNSGDPDAGDTMQHREWFNWQMQAHPGMSLSDLKFSGMKIQIARRLTYDISNRAFGSQGGRSLFSLAAPFRRAADSRETTLMGAPGVFAANTRGGVGDSSNSRNFFYSREPFRDTIDRDNANFREIAAAAVSALTPARLGPTHNPPQAPLSRIQNPTNVRP